MRPGGTEEQKYFNPRSPHGERRNPTGSGISERHFNPRSPHGERPALTAAVSSGEKFQSTLPARGATHQGVLCRCKVRKISIHAPRTGSDGHADAVADVLPRISIHAPRTGSDLLNPFNIAKQVKFQSTLPARGATLRADGSKSGYTHFNPRSPHGERQVILIVWACASLFQSTLPARGATHQGVLCRCKVRKISIHAPRTGSDGHADAVADVLPRISIHAPRTGSDLLNPFNIAKQVKFQSTLPARGATQHRHRNAVQRDFNPRSPHGERQCGRGLTSGRITFQSTLPARGATPRAGDAGRHQRDFNPRSPHGERRFASSI